MDLPTCPACKQSVLDDDAEVCPFCGASMSGKPGAAAPPPKPQPATAAPKQDEPPPEKEAAPIEADTKAVAKAVPVRRKRVKGLVLRVRCPMCETEGWVPAKAAGREVRCANKECLVPIFTAPELPKKTEPEAEKKGAGVSIPIVIASVVAVAAGVGVGVWWMFKGTAPTQLPATYDPSKIVRKNDDDPQPDNGEKPVVPAVAVPTVAEVRDEVRATMALVARDVPLIEKPRARGLVAGADSRAGDVAAADQQLEWLSSLSAIASIDRVGPLAEIGWAELRAGDAESANRRAELAIEAIGTSPLPGRPVTDALGKLAALLHVLDRTADAKSVLDRDPNDPANRELAFAEVQARASRSFDVDREYRIARFLPPESPASSLVVTELVDRDRWDAALAFAKSRPSAADQSDSLVLLAELIAARRADDARLQTVLAALKGPAERSALARVATRRLVSGTGQPVRETLERAASTSLPAPGAVAAFPDVQTMLTGAHGFGKDRPAAATATAELGRALALEAQLDAEPERAAAWQAYAKALAYVAAAAPPLEVVAAQQAVAEGGSVAGVAPARLTDYRIRLGELERISQTAFDLKVAFLIDASRHGLAGEVWTHVNSPEFEESLPRMLATPLGPVLTHHARGETAAAVQQALAGLPAPANVQAVAAIEPGVLLTADATPASIARRLSGETSGAEVATAIVRLGCLLQREQGRAKSIEFVGGLSSPFTASETALFVEAQSALGAEPHLAWRELDEATPFSNLVKVAACEGLLLATEAAAEKPLAAVAGGE